MGTLHHLFPGLMIDTIPWETVHHIIQVRDRNWKDHVWYKNGYVYSYNVSDLVDEKAYQDGQEAKRRAMNWWKYVVETTR